MGTGKLAGKWDDILGGGGGGGGRERERERERGGVTLQCNSPCLFILREPE